MANRKKAITVRATYDQFILGNDGTKAILKIGDYVIQPRSGVKIYTFPENLVCKMLSDKGYTGKLRVYDKHTDKLRISFDIKGHGARRQAETATVGFRIRKWNEERSLKALERFKEDHETSVLKQIKKYGQVWEDMENV